LNQKSATLAAWCNGLQVSIGLLLFGVTTVSTLAEERTAGGLDVLLTTPLPTWSIVWGKWLGSFRAMVRVLMLPVAVVAALAAATGSWFAVGVFVALVLSYGATLISLALLLATWIRRPVRAIAVLVTLYVAMTVGWLFVIMEARATTGLTIGSPFYGAGDLTYEIGERHELANSTAWGVGWTAVYAGFAAFLLMLTRSSGFEMRLGRAGARAETVSSEVMQADVP
jgi:ABC-type transport system involved in multi-copper enzyme maturation permease subunit